MSTYNTLRVGGEGRWRTKLKTESATPLPRVPLEQQNSGTTIAPWRVAMIAAPPSSALRVVCIR